MNQDKTVYQETFDKRAHQLQTLMKIVNESINNYIDVTRRLQDNGYPENWEIIDDLMAIFQRLVPVMPIFYDDEESHGFDEAMMMVNMRLVHRQQSNRG